MTSGRLFSQRRWRVAGLLALLTIEQFCFPNLARADAAQEAKALFEVGAQAYSLGDYSAAIEAFEEAHRRAARPGLLFSLAQAHRRAYQRSSSREHLYAAVTNYRRYLGEVRTGGRSFEAAEALTELDRVVRRLEQTSATNEAVIDQRARLMIACRTKGAVLSVDGDIAPRLPFIASVNPGRHTIALSARGFEPYEQAIEAPTTGVVALSIELKELPATLQITGPEGAEVLLDGRFVGWLPLQAQQLPAGRHRVSVRKKGYDLASRDIVLERGLKQRLDFELKTSTQRDISRFFLIGGIAGVGAAAGLGTVAWLKDRDAKDLREQYDGSGELSPRELQKYDEARSARDDFRTASIIAGSAGAVLGVTGLLLYFGDNPGQPAPFTQERGPRAPETDPALDFAAPKVGPSEVGVEVSGRF